jgi:aerobic-type carbon monoxide dehydrogenase small subunit (CoxS/CutS family)
LSDWTSPRIPSAKRAHARPRRQGDQALIHGRRSSPANDERPLSDFELAADRKVPILIHGGRGLPPIADDLARMVDRNPDAQLIVAHAGIADLAALADRLGGKAGVVFDTSVWSPLDLLGLYRLVGPEQVVYASDYPYGQQPASLLISIRTARLAQLNEEQVRGMLAGNANRIADGEPALEPSAPKGIDTFSQPMALARIHQYLSMATPLLWTRQQDRIGVRGLALNACDDRANGHRDELDQIKELLTVAEAMWLALPEDGEEKDRMAHTRATFRLIHLADIVASDDSCLSCASTGDAFLRRAGGSVARGRCSARTSASPAPRSRAGEGHCGACTVQIDGVPTLSCITLVHTVGAREVTTIEGLRDHPLVHAFVRTDAVQCGFCTPGQVVSAAALVEANPSPSRDEIRHAMSGNICRCGTYPKIEEAIRTWQD